MDKEFDAMFRKLKRVGDDLVCRTCDAYRQRFGDVEIKLGDSLHKGLLVINFRVEKPTLPYPSLRVEYGKQNVYFVDFWLGTYTYSTSYEFGKRKLMELAPAFANYIFYSSILYPTIVTSLRDYFGRIYLKGIKSGSNDTFSFAFDGKDWNMWFDFTYIPQDGAVKFSVDVIKTGVLFNWKGVVSPAELGAEIERIKDAFHISSV